MNYELCSVIGAGLAGCEAAWTLAEGGVQVYLYEMKPLKYSPAHKYNGYAELVCSNSLKASRADSAAGLLKEEMRRLGSVTLMAADKTAVPAGGALAVDREKFSDTVTRLIHSHPLIKVINEEAEEIPQGYTIIATGPLTDGSMARSIRELCGRDSLSFYDAAAPIITYDSIDKEKTFMASRYDRGDGYINCPMNKDQYEAFYEELVNAARVELKNFENLKVYEGCMPVEVMARRGADTLRYGPMKPVGLKDPETGKRPWAVVQLRQENSEATLYNLVGFQTNLLFSEQKRVFGMIPGLENAEYVRFGVMHRNTFIDSPKILDATYRMRGNDRIYFAGQITGVEGYMESAASGIMAAKNLLRRLDGQEPLILPKTTMCGALAAYISDPSVTNFQPMGSNMGILPPLPEKIRDKKKRYEALAERSLSELGVRGEIFDDYS